MKQNRIKRLTIRFTEPEHKVMMNAYKKSTCRKIVVYARKLILGKPVTVNFRNQSMDEFMQELIRLRRDFSAVGNNFNQVVKKINSVQDESLQKIWLPYAQTLQQELLERMKHIQERINQFSAKWLQK